MSSKAKKSKRKAKIPSDETKKVCNCFSPEEISEIKNVLKIRDLTGVPVVTCAVCLNKLETLKKVLKEGYDVNQTGPYNMTPLMWAIKSKNMEIIEFLLKNGADPTVKTESGDNILILALEQKLWDEDSMINLWKYLEDLCSVDVNVTNKNGHNILHMCVRRDWEKMLKILLKEKPDIDAGNSNGVTPLMIACFRNNISIINTLIEAGADILKQDQHGRMTLCYAITSVKLSNLPSSSTERILTELKKKSSVEAYVKGRLNLVIAIGQKSEISGTTSEMLLKIIRFTVKHMDGVPILLNDAIFWKLLDVLKLISSPGVRRFLMAATAEVLCYSEQCRNFQLDTYLKLVSDFQKSGWVEELLTLLGSKSENPAMLFELLLLSYDSSKFWAKTLQENAKLLQFLLNNPFNPDAARSKILRARKREMRQTIERLNDFKPQESFPKKAKKRTKVAKSKTTDSIKKCNKEKIDDFQQIFPKENEDFRNKNPIVSSIQHLLKNAPSDSGIGDSAPTWQKQLQYLNTPCLRTDIDSNELQKAMETLKESEPGQIDSNSKKSLEVILEYLKHIFQMIVDKYKKHWEKERSGENYYFDTEHIPWLQTNQNLQVEERQTLQKLTNNFENLIKYLDEVSSKDVKECLRTIKKTEKYLLNYKVRGIKTLSYVSDVEPVTVQYSSKTLVSKPWLLEYMEKVLNNEELENQDIELEVLDNIEDVSFVKTYKSETPLELYYREMSLVPKLPKKDKTKEIESKLNTMANGYHLINSILSLCGDEEEPGKKTYGISDLNHPFRRKFVRYVQYPEISQYMPQRLKSQIASLQENKNFQKMLQDEIRIGSKEQRVNYIISAGINFNAVELGLDRSNQPLAVKRVQRESWVGKILKTLVDPLLGVIDTHLLHYFACEYEENELILVTPLCKWNLSQYVQILRLSGTNTIPGVTVLDIVKQFLSGIMVLHKYEVPIVHGNLKPSNVFIDFNGMIKIAEFGIYKALYKIIEAPKSSLIWFSKETLEIYQNSSILECSLKSDIQVSGMLIYFILTCGKHPFGTTIEEILQNIQGGIPGLNVRNGDLKNLLLWMMLSDFSDRPSIAQILSHPFFWSTAKKWSFVLCCCGIKLKEYPLVLNIEKLHRSIDTFSENYTKLHWHEAIVSKLPFIRVKETDNLVGLLKYIKYCFDYQTDVNVSESEISCIILSLFPSLPIALYRTLQHTNWLKHDAFMPFVTVF